MRRFFVLAVLVSFTIPFGASVVGCGKKATVRYCNGGDSGPVAGQVKSISLSPTFATYGESIDYGSIGSSLSASAVDCFGDTVSVSRYTYASSDLSFADINPSTGAVCGGTYNRFSGGGVPDYTTCVAPAAPPTNAIAYVTATADGATSNAIPVYVHPKVTAIVLGAPTAQCPANLNSTTADPATNCCPVTTGAVVVAQPYLGGSCLSQGTSAQLTARVYASTNGTTLPSENVTCRVGHLQYSAQTSSVFTIDQNGVATAAQPGSSIVSASITNSGSGGAAGFFSTCPPASINLSVSGQPAGTSTAIVQVGTSQPLIATILDKNGVPLTGVALTFSSTNPSTIPAGSGTIVPSFPGAATITATCNPPSCNPAPFSQLGLYGNGEPITSNGIQVVAPGNNASVLYIGSTNSQYVLPVDFSTNQAGNLVKLPYTPNSMVITPDGSTIFFGSTTALMTLTTGSNAVSTPNLAAPGIVLAASPDGSSIVLTDPVRKTISLATSGGGITSTYGGVGIAAQYSPDSQTVYIAGQNQQFFVHSTYTGWTSYSTSAQYQDVAVTVPSVGAFFATNTAVTEGRTYCPTLTSQSTANPPVTTNAYYPIANDTAVRTDKVAATNDSNHILGATVTPTPTLQDIAIVLAQSTRACTTATAPVSIPTSFTTKPLASITASAITGVIPASNSALAFVTYTGTSGQLPLYVPSTGVVSYVTLTGGATLAPVAGVFSTDNSTFYTGTSGDNQVHLLTVKGTTATDTSIIAPKLPDANGNPAVPNLLTQRAKRATS